ncbi:DUF799 family lipoprotein [bacterium]|nr:DUF799 family lipoprotein [bacterium]
MNTYRLNSLAALAVAALIGGCALAPYENPIEAINYSSDHVALAVKGQYRSIAVLPFKNDSPYETADEFARRTFVAQLTSHKSYDVQRTSHTDARLKDLTRAAIDQKNWQELESAVNADMLVFGHVLEEYHSWGLVYAKTRVRVRIDLIDARTGALLWTSEDTRSRLTGGIDPFAMVLNTQAEYMWTREILNRYDELFRDMMQCLPDRTAK